MSITNKKTPEEIKKDIDEVLDQPSPEIVEPSEPVPSAAPSEPVPSEPVPSEPAPVAPVVPEPPKETPKPAPVVVTEPEPPVVIEDITEPTEEELRQSVLKDGVDWDELTNFEKAMAKRNLTAEKKLESVTKGFQAQKQVVEWNKKVDTFLDSINNDPKYIDLSGHEAEFKKFASGFINTDIETLILPAFLHNLPPTPNRKGSLLEHGGGGEKEVKPKESIDDADFAKKLRETDPREYARQLKAGKIKIEVD